MAEPQTTDLNQTKLKLMDDSIKTLNGGMVVVIQGNATPGLFCTSCSYPLKTMEDSAAFKKHGVCSRCDDRWTCSPGVSWTEPDKTPKALAESGFVFKGHLDYKVEWNEFLDEKKLFSRPKLTLK